MRAYEIVTKLPVDTERLPEQDAVAVQAKIDWLESTETKKFFTALSKQSDSLVADAVGLAIMNSTSENNKQIVQKLVQAHTLRKVMVEYGSVKS